MHQFLEQRQGGGRKPGQKIRFKIGMRGRNARGGVNARKGMNNGLALCHLDERDLASMTGKEITKLRNGARKEGKGERERIEVMLDLRNAPFEEARVLVLAFIKKNSTQTSVDILTLGARGANQPMRMRIMLPNVLGELKAKGKIAGWGAKEEGQTGGPDEPRVRFRVALRHEFSDTQVS